MYLNNMKLFIDGIKVSDEEVKQAFIEPFPMKPFSDPVPFPQYTSQKQAQVCPVCNGKQTVPAGFYGDNSTAANDVTCRSCGGRGIVWS